MGANNDRPLFPVSQRRLGDADDRRQYQPTMASGSVSFERTASVGHAVFYSSPNGFPSVVQAPANPPFNAVHSSAFRHPSGIRGVPFPAQPQIPGNNSYTAAVISPPPSGGAAANERPLFPVVQNRL